MPELDDESRRLWSDFRRAQSPSSDLLEPNLPTNVSGRNDYPEPTISLGDASEPVYADVTVTLLNVRPNAFRKIPIGVLFTENLLGQRTKIADIPPGLLTPEIARCIMQAYIEKGAPLTVAEVMPLYGK